MFTGPDLIGQTNKFGMQWHTIAIQATSCLYSCPDRTGVRSTGVRSTGVRSTGVRSTGGRSTGVRSTGGEKQKRRG